MSNRKDIGPTGFTADIFGFHYSLITHPFNSQQLVGIITMVIPGSDANIIGLKRGFSLPKWREP
ncbi:hypothetical protein [Paraflavitalea speifideaquila]|uniref:hypothetical protein n=1 Tax=Paraflavitalea speifideaquila TaxID=3076558 RepID=UPI0028E7312B|nr:hypothetical protein [Paraflavitalea speifideiaquila]